MKSPWTRFMSMTLKKYKSEKAREAEFRRLFLTHHQFACEIITNKKGEPLAALYFSPTGMHQMETKSFFRKVQERVCYSGELDIKGNKP